MRKHKPARLGHRRSSIRCAVYTRKSSEEGLDQAFNSLDAQREACEAYIRSQRHEGWICLPALYDDGGISGATMERPALQQLLADIEAGAIDTVVVYKVDRLTRSLHDFARIVEVFDRWNVSFVSVTQQFNTTTSMGRLTLNMLLSFAQFEREVTGERIRDKIAASKRKGMWMGGLPPLGYRVQDRKLVVVEEEAETVRFIYRRYAALGSVRLLKEELDRAGILSKVRIDRHGRRTGGVSLARGALYLMLQNRIYLGEIVHKEASYPGEHEPIIDKALWDVVQAKLAVNRIDRETGARAAEPSLLAGLLYDASGERMTPSHANKKGRRYRYYVSRRLVTGTRTQAPSGRRVPAGDLEILIVNGLREFLLRNVEVHAAVAQSVPDIGEAHAIATQAAALSRSWPELPLERQRAILLFLIDRIDLRADCAELHIHPGRLPTILRDDCTPAEWLRAKPSDGPALCIRIPAELKRAGLAVRLLLDAPKGQGRPAADRSLHRLLAQAQRYNAMVMRAGGRTMEQIAADAGVGRSYFTRILRLSFLAPDIVQAILHDHHPIELNARRLAAESRLPASWVEQRRQLKVGASE